MANFRGMIVRLKTKNEGGAGTDDHIYVGVVGSGGGREFPLDVHGFNDFEKGTDIKYWLSDVWDGTALSGAKNPWQSQGPWWNNPKYFSIDMDKVDYVYLRKHSHKSGSDDDAWKMDLVEITLYGNSPQKRTFRKTGDIWLANEHGLQVWIPEA